MTAYAAIFQIPPVPGLSRRPETKFGGIEGLPTTMLYERQGILRYKGIGFEVPDRSAVEG
jgi:hypothetical protein